EDPTLIEKERLRRKGKLRIAACAAGLVKEGQVVILDSGTTTTAIGRALRNFRNVTIVTNAVNIAAELSGASVEVILTGGTLRKNSFSLVGPIAEETLRRLNADILFLGVDGFDVHYGLSTPNLLEAKVNRVMVEAAKRTVAVCDSSKFGRRSLSLIVPTSALQGPGSMDLQCQYFHDATELLFIGCGSSYYIALAAAASWKMITGRRARAVAASELLLYPNLVLADSSGVAAAVISRSGRTSE